MSSVAIYMEGGGNGPAGKAALRQGMDAFLAPLKDAARARSWRWKLVCCGSRQDTYKAFRAACGLAETALVLLLVDAESAVAASPPRHLHTQDGWDFAGIPDPTVHMMTQTMETWLVADGVALSRYYGQGFNPAALPQAANLEAVEKQTLASALRRATQASRKGAYHKIRHAGDLLHRLAPDAVGGRCASCRRLFDLIGSYIAGA